MTHRDRTLFLLLLAGTLVAAPRPASAQSIWMPREGKHVNMLEFLHPSEDHIDSDTFTGGFFLSGRTAISPSLTFVDQVPFAHHSAVRTYYDGTINGFVTADVRESMVGNIYLGIEGTPRTSRIFGEGGVRLPLASIEKPFAAGAGALADVRRAQAFFPKTISLESAVNFWSGPDTELHYRLRISPVIEFDREEATSRLTANYSGQIGYHGSALRLGTAISGRVAITNSYGPLTSRSLNQIEFHSDFLAGPLRPGIELKIPFGRLSQGVGTVMGASLIWIH